jgi:hypothetical protein
MGRVGSVADRVSTVSPNLAGSKAQTLDDIVTRTQVLAVVSFHKALLTQELDGFEVIRLPVVGVRWASCGGARWTNVTG